MTNEYCLKVEGNVLEDSVVLSGKIKTETNILLDGKLINSIGAVEYYDGSYTIIPSSQEQIINIGNKRAVNNIVIEPIPNNYGLITWNGSYLTVS